MPIVTGVAGLLTALAGVLSPTPTEPVEVRPAAVSQPAPVADPVAVAIERRLALCPGLGATTAGNGRLAAEDLCPLQTAPGHALRADAAAAFDVLSAAYLAAQGEPLVVTDSYRSLGGQQALAARKPRLAARPGTSNHGWGTAVDLGGGVHEFGSMQHAWMRAHAPRYGWALPEWASQSGSRPEPWHWEFVGR